PGPARGATAAPAAPAWLRAVPLESAGSTRTPGAPRRWPGARTGAARSRRAHRAQREREARRGATRQRVQHRRHERERHGLVAAVGDEAPEEARAQWRQAERSAEGGRER